MKNHVGLLLLLLAVLVTVDDRWTIHFSSSAIDDVMWFSWSKNLSLTGEGARQLRDELNEKLGTSGECINFDLETGERCIGRCK